MVATRKALSNVQIKLNSDMDNADLMAKERSQLGDYKLAREMEIVDMRQKTEEELIMFGDRCS